MHKSRLIDFISKYTIKKIDSVTWEVNKNNLRTRIISDDKSMIGEVVLLDFKLDDDFVGSKLGVYQTGKLLKMLAPLQDDIDILPYKVGDKVVSLRCKAINAKMNFPLSDLAVIPHVPPMKRVPDTFELQLKIDDTFIETFLKSKSALPEVVVFSVEAKGTDKGEILLGQTDVNTDTFTLEPDNITKATMEKMYFNAEIFADILSANKDVETTLEISSEGLARIKYETKEYKAEYFLVAKKGQ